MTEVTLQCEDIKKMMKIIHDNDIVGLITITKEDGFGIGSVLEMSWDACYNRYPAKITIEVSGVEDW